MAEVIISTMMTAHAMNDFTTDPFPRPRPRAEISDMKPAF
jgi:hypothetical protein